MAENLRIEDVYGHHDQKGFTICWSYSKGFGQTSFRRKKGRYIVDDECMGREFVKQVLDLFLSGCIMESDYVAGCTFEGKQIDPKDWSEGEKA